MDINQAKKRYKKAIEKSLPHIPVKDGIIDLNSIWVETSLPKDLIIEILENEDVKFPGNVKRIIYN